MPIPDDLVAIIERFQKGDQTGEDVITIQQILNQLRSNRDPSTQNQNVQQVGKYNNSLITCSRIYRPTSISLMTNHLTRKAGVQGAGCKGECFP